MRKTLFTLLALLIMSSSFFISSAAIVIPASANAEKPVPAAIKAAITGFNKLSKKEKKERIKEVKKDIKEFKAAKKTGKAPSTNTLLLVILAILLPPLAVYLHQGEINKKFWICLLLTLLLWLPGVIYALIVILGN